MASLSLPTPIAKSERRRTAEQLLQPSTVILHPFDADSPALDKQMPMLEQADFIAIVSSFRVHLGDESAAANEAHALHQVQHLPGRVVVFRAGHVLGAATSTSVWLRRFGFAYPMIPARLRCCFVTESALEAAIDAEKNARTSRRQLTLLGPNRPWKDVLREHRPKGVWSQCLTGICYLLALLMLGHIAALVLDLLAWLRPSLRRWNFDTLRPKSFAELLALYNPHNFAHVKIVGYNNGVVHFGHRFPGKTIVSTVLCNRIVRTHPDVIKVDCGTTIRKAKDYLATAEQELYVLPNYSYVCFGTAFFVPIHGSAADYSTVAETVVKALLYDPVADRFILATSEDPEFREHVYDFACKMLVLRLWMRVKAKSAYFVHQQELENADAAQLLNALRDTKAANVEIRKSKGSSNNVQLAKYYRASQAGENLLEVPRDSLGRLWDRLEENALTSFLMHALTRWFAWHVELFFTAEEFATFWNSHQSLPLKKIQLRYIRRDGLPHSPFREQDCVSVDMFMFRWSRKQFESYLQQTFAIVRSNPGKHSN